MANWAKLQEQLTGLTVVKRARNSIHFDKGNGEIVANFSGKPCHYQDTDGLWKPIDTKLLLLPDGFYGSPHSDVKIHKDGRVKAGGYQQKSALVAAKEGVVDGDKIVREFKFGTQYLYMKEDGFRQETVITRPPTTAEAKYLIASESGELPSKYKRSDITAVDADGAVHEFVNLGQFKKWLDAAAYPVTIDPDFTGTSSPRDTFLSQANPDDINGSKTTFFDYNASKALLEFDLSSIDSSSICSAASLALVKVSVSAAGDTITTHLYQIASANSDWTEAQSTWNKKDKAAATAWAGSAGMSTAGTDYINTSWGSVAMDRDDAQYTTYTYTINASGLAVLQGWFGDASNPGMMISYPNAGWALTLGSSENATAGYRPLLSITYTAASSAFVSILNNPDSVILGGSIVR